jgi:hypothetical protein
MKDNIKLILLKSNNCGHCISFGPIFEEVIKKNIYECHIFDTTDDKNNILFKDTFPNLVEKFDGAVPTIYLMVDDKFQEIKSSKVKNDSEKELKNAVNEFINNVKNAIKTLKSEKYTLYVQAGGNKNEEYYKYKYIKYKTKYLQEKIK